MAISRSINGQSHNLAKESPHSCRDSIRYNFNVHTYPNHE